MQIEKIWAVRSKAGIGVTFGRNKGNNCTKPEQCTYHCLPSVAQTTDNNSTPVADALLCELLGLCGCPGNQQASTHRSLHRTQSHSDNSQQIEITKSRAATGGLIES